MRNSSVDEVVAALRENGASTEELALIGGMAKAFLCVRHPAGQKSILLGPPTFRIVCEECMQESGGRVDGVSR